MPLRIRSAWYEDCSRTYEPIDFLAALVGYAISGERTLADFFERAAHARNGVYGAVWTHTPSSSVPSLVVSWPMWIATAWKPSVCSFNSTVLQTGGRRRALAVCGTERGVASFSLMWMPRAKRHDNERCPVIQRSLLLDADSRRSALPVTSGASVVRWSAPARPLCKCIPENLVGTSGGRGNGDYRDELASALQAIAAYLKHFALAAEVALVRLDGQYGDAAVIAQLIVAGVSLLTRGKGYELLEHPQVQSVLAR